MTSKYVLALSGNDIFSGGGLHADLNTYAANKQHGFVAVTCLTGMTENGFEVFATPTDLFQVQLNSIKEVPFAGIKIGLLPNVAVAEAALEFVKTKAGLPVVLDPVLVCKETHDVEVSALREELLKFFPHVTIITPNLVEAELLTQRRITSLEDMKDVARELHGYGVPYVVVKGGNRLDQERAIDVFYDGQNFEVLEQPVLSQNNTGAGCTFASSIASGLVEGLSPLEAVKAAKAFVHKAILHSTDYGVTQYDID